MQKRRWSVLRIVGTIVTAVALAIPVGATPGLAQSTTPANCQTFAATAKPICGSFLSYWQGNGGLARQGYPISGEMQEKSDTDGKMYKVQYMERAVFEQHPENKAPNDVLLSLLGAQFYKQKYPSGAPGQLPNISTGSQLFAETGMRVGGGFLEYWQKNGGLPQFGYPVSNEFAEKSALDGKVYTVQYFQRAVFEFHPENAPQYRILLSQLGRYQFDRKYATGQTPPNALAQGLWGGQHVHFENTGTGVQIEYDCGHGTIDQTVTLDSAGNWSATGTHTFERGGPASDTDQPSYQAEYKGTVKGKTMTFTVIVITPEGKQELGPFTSTLGEQPMLFKCM